MSREDVFSSVDFSIISLISACNFSQSWSVFFCEVTSSTSTFFFFGCWASSLSLSVVMLSITRLISDRFFPVGPANRFPSRNVLPLGMYPNTESTAQATSIGYCIFWKFQFCWGFFWIPDLFQKLKTTKVKTSANPAINCRKAETINFPVRTYQKETGSRKKIDDDTNPAVEKKIRFTRQKSFY